MPEPNKKSKNHKLRGHKLAQSLGPNHPNWWANCAPKEMVRSCDAVLEDRLNQYLAEVGGACPWQPLGKVWVQPYAPMKPFHHRKVHGAFWITPFMGSDDDDPCRLQYICLNMERDVPDLEEFQRRICAHPWHARGQDAKRFTFKQDPKTHGEEVGDHESPYNVLFMTIWGDTWEGGVTKLGDFSENEDRNMKHLWLRTNESTSDPFKSQAMCNMLCHLGIFTPCFPGGPGGNYGALPGSPTAFPGRPMATHGAPCSSWCRRPFIGPMPAPTAPPNQSPLDLGTPVADEVATPTPNCSPVTPPDLPGLFTPWAFDHVPLPPGTTMSDSHPPCLTIHEFRQQVCADPWFSGFKLGASLAHEVCTPMAAPVGDMEAAGKEANPKSEEHVGATWVWTEVPILTNTLEPQTMSDRLPERFEATLEPHEQSRTAFLKSLEGLKIRQVIQAMEARQRDISPSEDYPPPDETPTSPMESHRDSSCEDSGTESEAWSEDSQTEDADRKELRERMGLPPPTPDEDPEKGWVFLNPAEPVPFESLPRKVCPTGADLGVRTYRGHTVSCQQDIQQWQNLEQECHDLRPHACQMMVYGWVGDPYAPLSVQYLAPNGSFEPCAMRQLGHYLELPANFPRMTVSCGEELPRQILTFMRAVGARGHTDMVTTTSYH